VPSDRSHGTAMRSFQSFQSAAQTAKPSSATSANLPSPSATYLVTAAPRSSHETQPSDTRNHRRAVTPQQFYIGERANRQTSKINTGAERTKLRKGLSLLVDLGAQMNFVGANTAEAFARTAADQGLEVECAPKDQSLTVCGIGNDASTCKLEATFPIAVMSQDSTVVHDKFKANITEDCGNNLPAILGSVEMQNRDAVILLRHGKEMIAFPGPEGYTIQWSEGTICLPMTHAPSGHLVIPCDCFGQGTTTHPTVTSRTDYSNDIVSGTPPVSTPSWTDHVNAIDEVAPADVPGNPNSVPGIKKDFATQTDWPTEPCTDDPQDLAVLRCLCHEGGKRCMWPPIPQTHKCPMCTEYCNCTCYGCDPHTSDSEVDEPHGRRSARPARTRTRIPENGTPGWKQKMLTIMIMIALLICQVICAMHYDATTSTGPSPFLDPAQIVTDTSQINLDDFRPSASET
jgi:hypothetical protein